MKLFKFLAIPLLLFSVNCTQQSASCPTKEDITKIIEQFGGKNPNIESISRVEGVKGLCEVVIKDGINPFIFYVSNDGKKAILGSLLDIPSKTNITNKRKLELTRLTQDQVSKLDSLVDMEYGKGTKHVYYITDPDCDVCRKQEDKLLKWAEEKGVKLKVVLYPIPIHKKAQDRSVAILCDKKGFEEVKKGYESKNLCEDGKKKILENVRFLGSELKLIGLPHVIGKNGKLVSGVLIPKELDKLIE